KHNREPTPEEIGDLVEMPAKKVEEILKLGQEPVSLEAPVGGEDGDASLGDFIEDAATDRPLEIVANRIRDEDLQKVLDSLPWRERRVIELRYGLGDKGPMTLEDIGHEVGVTRERVRQIESKTLAMLKSSRGADRLAGNADEAWAGSACHPIPELVFGSWKRRSWRVISDGVCRFGRSGS